MSDELTIKLEAVLNEYTSEVIEALDKAQEEQATETVAELKSTSPKKTGKYSRGWGKTKEGRTTIIHNKRHGSLTHLLEFGHATVNGGRTRAFPHIKPAEENAKKGLEEKIRRKLEK